MPKEQIDRTAGKQDWWNPEESRYMLDILMDMDESELRALMQKLEIQEPANWFHKLYAAMRIKTAMCNSMDFADALDFVAARMIRPSETPVTCESCGDWKEIYNGDGTFYCYACFSNMERMSEPLFGMLDELPCHTLMERADE